MSAAYDNAKKEFIKLINSISNRYTPTQVFTDFVTMAAMSISNSVDFNQKREDKYMELIRKYEPKEQKAFPELLGLVVKGLEAEFGDFLGSCFEDIGASNAKTGQFFTPYHVSRLCAEVTFDKQTTDKAIAEKGYIGINEPAAGGGSMIIAFLEVLYKNGYNFQTQSLTIAQDIDYRCSYMCYVQLSLLGAPAIVCIGDTLKVEVWEELHTPFYVYNYLRFKNWHKKVVPEALAVMNEQEKPVNATVSEEKPVEVSIPSKAEETPPEAIKQPEQLQLSFF